MPDLMVDAKFLMVPLYWKKEADNHLRLFPYPDRKRLPQLHSSLVITDYRHESIAAASQLPLEKAIATICAPACVTVRLFEGSCEGIICGVELRETQRDNNPKQLFSITGWHVPLHREKTSYEEQPIWSHELVNLPRNLDKLFVVLLSLTDSQKKVCLLQKGIKVEISDKIRSPFIPKTNLNYLEQS